MKWAAIDGDFEFADEVTFRGTPTPFQTPQGEQKVGLAFGLAMSSERFSGGERRLAPALRTSAARRAARASISHRSAGVRIRFCLRSVRSTSRLYASMTGSGSNPKRRNTTASSASSGIPTF